MTDKLIDEIEKLGFYKERIMNELCKMGMYPDIITVQEQLDEFDARLSLFTHKYISSGETFDAKSFNEEFELIAADLNIIYKLVYRLCTKQLTELKQYANTHIKELNRLAQKYEKRSKFEMGATSLGKTIFFQATGYDITIQNSTAIVDLGDIEVTNGSKIACLFEAENIKDSDVIFNFDGANCSPYSLNKDFYISGGKLASNKYTYIPPENETIKSARIMNVKTLEPNANNKYCIYAGRNKIINGYEIIDIDKNGPISIKDNIINSNKVITFYVLDADYINFNFSNEPKTKNFTGASIKNPQDRQKIIIEYDKELQFDIDTDGIIYAEKSDGVILEDKLLYPGTEDFDEYFIEEFNEENITTKHVKVYINNLKRDIPLVINSIGIKELSSLEGAD